MIPKNQRCNLCQLIKDADNFSIRVYRGNISLRKDCKSCVAARNRKYVSKNKEKVRASKKKYWEDNKHRLLEKHNEKSRQYLKDNPEKRRKSAREWAQRNRQKQREYFKARYNKDAAFNILV